MQKHVILHFQKHDPLLFTIFQKLPPLEPLTVRKPEELFESLCREIINQQLASKAAHAIYQRFLQLFPNRHPRLARLWRGLAEAQSLAGEGGPTPHALLQIPDETIRAVGLSWAKVKYVKDLARKVVDRDVLLEKLHALDDESVITELTKIKGIGRWTAEMFLMFSLGREDVFSHGDLGLRKAIIKLYRLKEKSEKEKIEAIVQKWIPYRTHACRILWQSLLL